MQVLQPNGIRIFNLTSGASLPDWLNLKKRRKQSQNERLALLQDLEMPAVTHSIQLSSNQQYILATGAYKPRIRCFDLSQLSLKFERGLDADVRRFKLLEDDDNKIVFLRDDRYIEFHTSQGFYYRTRIPRFGRDLSYYPSSCDLYIASASPEVYRLNLQQGRFLNPLRTSLTDSPSTSVNALEFSSAHGLLSLGTSEGTLECWDPRSRSRVTSLDLHSAIELYSLQNRMALPALSSQPTQISTGADTDFQTGDASSQSPFAVTCLKYGGDLLLATGHANGLVCLFDIRSTQPLLVKDQMNELPIRDVAFHRCVAAPHVLTSADVGADAAAADPESELDVVLSMDSKALKIWNRHSGKPVTAIEPGATLNSLCQVPGTGLLLLGADAPRIECYYVPALGAAPRWCAFLDALCEELEEATASGGERPAWAAKTFDDYKFLTREQLDRLGLSHLIGTDLLRAHLHGFFMDMRLYHKVLSLTETLDSVAVARQRRDALRRQIDNERGDRCARAAGARASSSALPSVNRELASRLLLDRVRTEGQPASYQLKKKQQKALIPLLDDRRFGALFSNADFEIDPDSPEFEALSPALAHVEHEKRRKAILQGKLAPGEEEDVGDAELEPSEREAIEEHAAQVFALLQSAGEGHRGDERAKSAGHDSDEVASDVEMNAASQNAAEADRRRRRKRAKQQKRESEAELSEAPGSRRAVREVAADGEDAMGLLGRSSRHEESSAAAVPDGPMSARFSRETSRRDRARQQHVNERSQLKRSARDISKHFDFTERRFRTHQK